MDVGNWNAWVFPRASTLSVYKAPTIAADAYVLEDGRVVCKQGFDEIAMPCGLKGSALQRMAVLLNL